MNTSQAEWDQRFLQMAQLVSKWSHDPSSQIGAVFVDDRRRVLSSGYNGLPRGIENTEERWNNRTTKYKYIVHAEANAIYNATWNGVSLDGSTLYVYGLPVCSQCARASIQVGAKRIVVADVGVVAQRWYDEWAHSCEMFSECGLDVQEVALGDAK